MTQALLVLATASMYHFTGTVPTQLSEQTLERFEGRQVLRHLDERYLNEEIRLIGGNLAVGAQVLFQQKILLRTEF
jgi:hypothetical protein